MSLLKHYTILIDSANWYCQSNLTSCSALYRYLIKNGHKITHAPSQADFIIINSCGVFKDTEDVTIALFKKYYSLKRKDAQIIMYGCLVKINKDLLANLDLIAVSFEESWKLDDIFCNNIKFDDISSYCNEQIIDMITGGIKIYKFEETKLFHVPKLLLQLSKKFKSNYDWIMSHFSYKNKMSVEIVERGTGCTGNCSYCVIKKAKGKIRSRKVSDILQDIEEAYDSTETLVLVADDCGGYGVDTRSSLPELMYEIYRRFPRLSMEIFYLNPIWLIRQREEYIDVFKNVKIDFAMITVESGSNKVIKNMNRHYDMGEVMRVIKLIKKVSPNTFLATNFVAGFPGESTIDFLKTLWMTHYFDLPFPYPYQEREGADAVYLPNKKSHFIISLRYLILLFFCRLAILNKLFTFSARNVNKNRELILVF